LVEVDNTYNGLRLTNELGQSIAVSVWLRVQDGAKCGSTSRGSVDLRKLILVEICELADRQTDRLTDTVIAEVKNK